MTEPDGTASSSAAILHESLSALIAESQSLRADVHTAEVARRRNALVNMGVLLMLALFVLLVLTVSLQNNQLSRQVRDANARVVDCTTAGGNCYEQGKARTGAAITAILRADIYVAECARLYPGESGPAFDAKMEACVEAKLAAPPRPAPSASPTR